jgi:CheY-like chemotaxis protein
LSNKTILFADDSATMRTIMEKAFAAEPYSVVTVPSGEAAVDKAREVSPAIVIADAGMPGMSGYDVCEALRGEGSLASTPVIIMSGVSSPYDEARGSKVGATEHVKKPFDTTKLIEKVGELIGAAPAPVEAVAEPAPAEAAAEPAPTEAAAEPGPRPSAPPIPPAAAAPKAPPSPEISAEALKTGAPSAAGMSGAEAKRPHKKTMIFGQDAAKPAPKPAPEVKPIEIEAEAPAAGEDTFQVGTLAELAQMDDKGSPITPDVAGRELELDEPEAPPAEPAAPAAATVEQKAAAAGDEIAAKVGGLTAEQVEAIRALTGEVVERVVWEVVPDLAEAMIREQLDKLLEE